MTKYVLAYSGGNAEIPEGDADQAALMEAWGAWFGTLGEAVLDGGNPFGPSSTVKPDGSVSAGGSVGLTGYSVISADSLEGAQKMAKGCPVLEGGGSVDVYEAIEM